MNELLSPKKEISFGKTLKKVWKIIKEEIDIDESYRNRRLSCLRAKDRHRARLYVEQLKYKFAILLIYLKFLLNAKYLPDSAVALAINLFENSNMLSDIEGETLEELVLNFAKKFKWKRRNKEGEE